jgi:TIR domain
MPKKTKKGAPTSDDASNVFVAWGGVKSELVAQALAKWLPKLIDSVRPWMSKENIRSGTAWFPTIMGQLAKTEFGIVCLTPDNVDNRWIHFEAGAIAKRVSEDARVTPYLIGMTSSHVKSPFNALQHREAKKDPTFDLVLDINKATGATVDQKVLKERFEMFWPELEGVIAKAEATHASAVKPPDLAKMVEEILGITRSTGGDIARVLEMVQGSTFMTRPLASRNWYVDTVNPVDPSELEKERAKLLKDLDRNNSELNALVDDMRASVERAEKKRKR